MSTNVGDSLSAISAWWNAILAFEYSSMCCSGRRSLLKSLKKSRSAVMSFLRAVVVIRRAAMLSSAAQARIMSTISPLVRRTTTMPRRGTVLTKPSCSSIAIASRIGVPVRLERERGELDPEARRLGVDPVGPADGQGADVLPRSSRQRLDESARVREHKLGDAPQLERKPRIKHVARGQPVMDPAARRPGRGGKDIDEGRCVVIGDALALGDRLHGEVGSADRLKLVPGRAVELLGRGNL